MFTHIHWIKYINYVNILEYTLDIFRIHFGNISTYQCEVFQGTFISLCNACKPKSTLEFTIKVLDLNI
jgi:hypothetical protein